MLESNATKVQTEEGIRKACADAPSVKVVRAPCQANPEQGCFQCDTLLKTDHAETYEQAKSVFKDQSATVWCPLSFAYLTTYFSSVPT